MYVQCGGINILFLPKNVKICFIHVLYISLDGYVYYMLGISFLSEIMINFLYSMHFTV